MMDRRDNVNAILLALVCERVKAECAKMIDAGATVAQVNDALPDVLLYYTTWQEETLSRCMRELDDMERPWPVDPPPQPSKVN